MIEPRVSVIMAAYNAEAFIGRAIDSVLAQTRSDLELIVIDDASRDATAAIIDARAAADSRVRHLRSEDNLGPGHARNIGIRDAKGEWIAILDADDWYEKTRLEALLRAAEEDGAPLVTDNQVLIEGSDGRPGRLLVEKLGDEAQRLTADDLLHGDHPGRARNLGLLKPMIRSQFISSHRILYDEDARLSEDFYFLLRCLRHTPYVLLVPRPFYNYRLHHHSLSNRPTLSGSLAIRTLHRRHERLFDDSAPTTAKLMQQRGRELDRYIRFKRLAEPLRRGQIRTLLQQALADPGGISLLVRGLARRLSRRLSDAIWRMRATLASHDST